MGGQHVLAVSLIALSLFSCRIESGDVPVPTIKTDSVLEVKSRTEIKGVLNGITAATGVVNRVQNALQRGLKQNGTVNGDIQPAKSSSLLEPSEGDELTFDANRPEAFKYKLNNSASLSLVTNSGTTVALLLSGVVNQNGDDVEILEAKLEIECVSSDETRRFRLMAQSHSEEDGQRVAEWSIDLSQMGEFYSYMKVEDEQVADIKGVLTVKMSKSQTEIAAKDFVQTIDDVAVSFETVAIVLSNKSMALSSVKVAGRVERSGAELGTFSMLKSENQEFGEFNLKLDLR